MKVNLNDRIRVKLTARGREIHRENFDDFWRSSNFGYKHQYKPPEEDADGWSTWQLWGFMEQFGKHMHIGFGPLLPVETEVEIETLDDSGPSPKLDVKPHIDFDPRKTGGYWTLEPTTPGGFHGGSFVAHARVRRYVARICPAGHREFVVSVISPSGAYMVETLRDAYLYQAMESAERTLRQLGWDLGPQTP